MNQNTNIVENPLSLKYMKIARALMKSVGSWPTESLNYQPRKIGLLQTWIICQTAILNLGQITFMIQNFRRLTFFLLGDVYVIMFLSLLTLYRCIIPTFKNFGVLAAKLINEYHLNHHKYKGGHFERIHLFINKLSLYFTVLIILMTLAAITLFNITPLYNNYHNGAFSNNITSNYTVQYSVYYKWPYFDQNDHFILSTCLNFWVSYTCGLIIFSSDLLLTYMVFQIIGHIMVLNYNFEHFPAPSSKTTIPITMGGSKSYIEVSKFTAEENKLIHVKIIECVYHHRSIVSFAEEVSSFYGPMLGLNYVYDMVCCCVLLLQIFSGEPEALAKYLPLTLTVFIQLVQTSVTFEVVGSQSEKIKDAVYSMPWESMDIRNQRSVCILLNRVQTPVHVTAMKLTTVGVQTMFQILKTTVSYFAFLRSIKD